MTRLIWVGGLVAGAACALAACGSTSGADSLFSSGGTNGTGGTASSSTSHHGPSGSTSPSSSTEMMSSSTGMMMSSSQSSVASSTAMSSSSKAVASSSTGNPLPQVACSGPVECNPGEVCCFNRGPNDHCGKPGNCGGDLIEISCDGPEDCPGSICCGDRDPNNMFQPYLDIKCQAMCDPINTAQVVICGNDASVCNQYGLQCQPSTVLPGYMICR